jgi:zinc transport system ATP-binding protein
VSGDTPLVEIESLTIRRHREALLDRVSIRIARGALHAIVGPNGAGKSTLLAALLGHIPFDGRIALHWSGAGTIGYVPQTFPIDPTLPVTVADSGATRSGAGVFRDQRERPSENRGLARTRGSDRLESRPLAVLSGGELRRVLLANALDPEPELLILDEPGSSLDEASAQWLENTLRDLKQTRRLTIVLVSHDTDRVRRLADRVTSLDRHVVAEGPPDEVFA